MAAPDLDDRLAVEHHRDTAAMLEPRGEIRREGLAQAGEFRVNTPGDRCGGDGFHG
jgi:hypothetical protein